MACEPAYVHFVNDRLRRRPVEWSVALPLIRVGVNHNVLHRRGAAVAFQARRLSTVIFWNNDRSPVRIQQELGRIKPHPARGIERSLHPISIKLTRLRAGHKCMPILSSAVSCTIDGDHARRADVFFSIEEHQLHAGSTSRIDAEIDAARNHRGAER